MLGHIKAREIPAVVATRSKWRRMRNKFVAELFADRIRPGTCGVIRDLLRRRKYENFYITEILVNFFRVSFDLIESGS